VIEEIASSIDLVVFWPQLDGLALGFFFLFSGV